MGGGVTGRACDDNGESERIRMVEASQTLPGEICAERARDLLQRMSHPDYMGSRERPMAQG